MVAMTDTKDVMSDSGGKENGITSRAVFLAIGIIHLDEIGERTKVAGAIPCQASLEIIYQKSGLDKTSMTLTSIIPALGIQNITIYKAQAADQTLEALGLVCLSTLSLRVLQT